MAGKTHMVRVGDEAAQHLFNMRLSLEDAHRRRFTMNEVILLLFREADMRHFLEDETLAESQAATHVPDTYTTE